CVYNRDLRCFPTRRSSDLLMVNNVLFQVIGVMDEKGASPMGQDQDDVVFVPYTTGSLRIFGQTHLRNITVAVADIDRMDEIEARSEEHTSELQSRENLVCR